MRYFYCSPAPFCDGGRGEGGDGEGDVAAASDASSSSSSSMFSLRLTSNSPPPVLRRPQPTGQQRRQQQEGGNRQQQQQQQQSPTSSSPLDERVLLGSPADRAKAASDIFLSESEVEEDNAGSAEDEAMDDDDEVDAGDLRGGSEESTGDGLGGDNGASQENGCEREDSSVSSLSSSDDEDADEDGVDEDEGVADKAKEVEPRKATPSKIKQSCTCRRPHRLSTCHGSSRKSSSALCKTKKKQHHRRCKARKKESCAERVGDDEEEEEDGRCRGRFLATLEADDKKLKDITRLLNTEKHRLEKIVQACDKLKQETVRKISLQPFGEIAQYRELLSGLRRECGRGRDTDDGCASEDGKGRVGAIGTMTSSSKKTSKRDTILNGGSMLSSSSGESPSPSPSDQQHRASSSASSSSASTGGRRAAAAAAAAKRRRADLALRVNALHQNVELAHENVRAKHDLLSRIHDSLVTVGFFRAPAELGSSGRDEVVINFARDDRFPSGLFIACCMLQDVFQQCMMHDHLLLKNNLTAAPAPASTPAAAAAAPQGYAAAATGLAAAGKSAAALAARLSAYNGPIQPPLLGATGVSAPSSLSPFLPLTPSGQSAATILRSAQAATAAAAALYQGQQLTPLTAAAAAAAAASVLKPAGTSTLGSTAAAGTSWSDVSKINCPTVSVLPSQLQAAAAAASLAPAVTTSTSPQPPTTQPPQQSAAHSTLLVVPPRIAPEKTVAETNRPHCFFDIRVAGGGSGSPVSKTVRVVIRVRPDKAPFMSENFISLCCGNNRRGLSYRGCRFFRCKPDDHVVCGDIENQNGSGGRSAFDEAPLFLAEQCPLKDHKGAVRMRGIERTSEGRCKVGSQFMVWVGDIDYKEYKYTLVFGEVTQGLKHLQDISRVGMVYTSTDTWVLKEEVVVVNCGVL